MKYRRWSVVAVVSLLPFGAALADFADQTPSPVAAIQPQRTVEHESLAESAELVLRTATRTSRELGIALENARRQNDMMMVTCLTDALETTRGAHADAITLITAMSATRNVSQARALVGEINRINQLLNSALQNAASCEGEDEEGDGVVVTYEGDVGSAFDPGTGGPMITSPIEPPPVSVPPTTPPTVDVMEPGTDMPNTPPTVSPMR